MSVSVQSQIMARVTAVTNGAAGATSWRTRMTAFKAAELPAINVFPDECDTDYVDSHSIERRLRFKLRLVTQAVDVCDAAIDPVYVAANAAIMSDPRLGGLAIFTREGPQKWEFEKGELDTVALVVTYEVEFSTTRSDPSVSWP